MIQVYEFAACIFYKNIAVENKRHSVIICQDADGAWFIQEKITKEERERGVKPIILEDSVEFDPIRFKVRNGLFDDNCRIFLN